MQKEREEQLQRVNAICRHSLWQTSRKRIEELEQDRVFCRHDVIHFLDVARLAWIENLEQHLGLEKEHVYAAALLHDIGRHLQYEQGIPHEEGSVMLAGEILRDCGFSDAECLKICDAIAGHRAKKTGKDGGLAGALYRADKASRMCLFCAAEAECNWPEEKKNREVRI